MYSWASQRHVPANKSIHLMAACGNRHDVLLRQGRQDKSISHVNAELTAAAATTGVAFQTRINALRFVPMRCRGGHATSRHANVNEAAIVMPDCIHPDTKRGNFGVWPLAEWVRCAGNKIAEGCRRCADVLGNLCRAARQGSRLMAFATRIRCDVSIQSTREDARPHERSRVSSAPEGAGRRGQRSATLVRTLRAALPVAACGRPVPRPGHSRATDFVSARRLSGF